MVIEYDGIMKTQRHIGGSFFPSNSPKILEPCFNENFGTFQVVPNVEEDTHFLVWTDLKNNQKVIAKHPNGYSCHTLLQRIMDPSYSWLSVEAQGMYIVDCGGEVKFLDEIIKIKENI